LLLEDQPGENQRKKRTREEQAHCQPKRADGLRARQVQRDADERDVERSDDRNHPGGRGVDDLLAHVLVITLRRVVRMMRPDRKGVTRLWGCRALRDHTRPFAGVDCPSRPRHRLPRYYSSQVRQKPDPSRDFSFTFGRMAARTTSPHE